MAKCIVFYHPGGPVKQRDARGWTITRHGRKFLHVSGKATASQSSVPKNEKALFFWGEYEAPSQGQPLHVPKNSTLGLPHRVETLIFPVPNHQAGNLNSDPFVFCGPFLYTNCQQLGPNNEPRNIQNLEIGDMILFGSHLGGCFSLDTCFVVSVITPLNSYQKQVQSGGVFDLVTNRLIRGLPVTVFEGAAWSGNNPFSFVPCWDSLNGNQGHPRPVLRPHGALSGVITPAQRRGIKGLLVLHKSTQPIFDEVVKQVLAQGCLLGTYIDHPQCGVSSVTSRQSKSDASPSRIRSTC